MAAFGDAVQGSYSISFQPVPASVTNMALFDKLTHHGIARADGVIIKCMEDYIDGFQVCVPCNTNYDPSGMKHQYDLCMLHVLLVHRLINETFKLGSHHCDPLSCRFQTS